MGPILTNPNDDGFFQGAGHMMGFNGSVAVIGGIFVIVFWLLLLTLMVLGVIWLAQQINRKK